MKVSRAFVKGFLGLFLIVILGNIITPFFSVWKIYYLLVLCFFVIVLFFLIYRKKDKGIVKFFKLLILLFSIGIVGYILYSNFIASQEFVYFYDIGSEKDINNPYLSPLSRVSEAEVEGSYRNLTGSLVYFDVPIPQGSDYALIQVRILKPFEERILLGARDKEEWSYLNKEIYNPFLGKINLTGRITRLNPEMPEINSTDEIPSGSVVASDQNIPLISKKQDFNSKKITINSYLRNMHTFYVYLNDSLDLKVEKQDINWYEGSDELQIILFDLNRTILGNSSIEDDGITDTSKEIIDSLDGKLNVQNLSEGVYILQLIGNADTVITKIKINTNKIVFNSVFSAESKNYLLDEDREVTLFTKSNRESIINFQTWHDDYLQNISVGNQTLEMSERSIKNSLKIEPGEHLITLQRSDVIISSGSYLTFSEENYFEPFEYSVVPLPFSEEDFSGIDYLITGYEPVEYQEDAVIASVKFDIKDLYVKDGKLGLMFNIPYLAEDKNETNIEYVKLDWIKLVVYKDGILKI